MTPLSHRRSKVVLRRMFRQAQAGLISQSHCATRWCTCPGDLETDTGVWTEEGVTVSTRKGKEKDMADVKREFGVIGLGRMGANLALQALEKGMQVVGFDIKGVPEELIRAGMVAIFGVEGFRENLSPPRPILIYIPAGPSVDRVIDDLVPRLDKGDVVVDAGNSYWGDSIRCHRRLAKKGIHLVDLGTSGGVEGARHGACFMAGGEEEAMARVEQILIYR